MLDQVAIVGVGYSGFRSVTPDLSYKELMFEAATRAYEDAGIDPRKDVGSFVCCTEDFWEGTSISDEYMPDQIGAALRPLCTVASDGIIGIATAYMHILSGLTEVAVVEAHSKASEVLTKKEIINFALDPTFERHLNVDPHAFAALEMRRYLHDSGYTEEHCHIIAAKNRRNALLNPRGVYSSKVTPKDVARSSDFFPPLKQLHKSIEADGGIVVVLASRKAARKLGDGKVWIKGIGWSSDTPWIEGRDFATAQHIVQAADRAYKMAKVRNPQRSFDLAEIDDTYAFKELQHMDALRLCPRRAAGKLVQNGETARDGSLPVNVSGGSLGVGNLLEASGLHRVLEAVHQLLGEAGKLQVEDAETAVVQGWRGIPTGTGAVAVLGS